MDLLLKYGADPNMQGGRHGIALQAATERRSHETVKFLLDHEADVTIQPKLTSRLSLLHVAAKNGDLDILKTLCDAGADIHLTSQNELGFTPLHIAVDNEEVQIVKYLLEKGASSGIENFGNINSLQLAMRKKHLEMVKILYSKATTGLSSISASDWRCCFDRANIEMRDDDSPVVDFKGENLETELDGMSYPLATEKEEFPARISDTCFMKVHRTGRRIL